MSKNRRLTCATSDRYLNGAKYSESIFLTIKRKRKPTPTFSFPKKGTHTHTHTHTTFSLSLSLSFAGEQWRKASLPSVSEFLLSTMTQPGSRFLRKCSGNALTKVSFYYSFIPQLLDSKFT